MAEEKQGKAKQRVIGGGKLLAALGALTAAVNGYGDLLEQQEQMLMVMSSKLNALSEKVAYLDGRVAGLPHELAEVSARVRMQPVSDIAVPEGEFELVEESVDQDGTSDIEDAPAPTAAPVVGREEPDEEDDGDDREDAVEEAPKGYSGTTAVVVEVDAPSIKTKKKRRPRKRIKDLAYQQIPVNLKNLEQFQEQIQLQEDELK